MWVTVAFVTGFVCGWYWRGRREARLRRRGPCAYYRDFIALQVKEA